MNPTVLVLSFAIASAPETCKAPQHPDSNRPATLRELKNATTRALRAESTADTALGRKRAIVALVELGKTLKHDRRLPTSPTLKRMRARIRSRLRAVQTELERQLERPSMDLPKPPARAAGAGGGRAQRADFADELIELIQATISPDAWDVNGGESSIYYYAPRHALVVRAPSEVHSSVRRTLVDLRRAGN